MKAFPDTPEAQERLAVALVAAQLGGAAVIELYGNRYLDDCPLCGATLVFGGPHAFDCVNCDYRIGRKRVRVG